MGSPYVESFNVPPCDWNAWAGIGSWIWTTVAEAREMSDRAVKLIVGSEGEAKA